MFHRFGLSFSRALVLVAPLALAACGGDDGVPPPLTTVAPPELAPMCAMVFTPAPELEGATRSAASDWSLALDCAITVGEGGVVLELAESIPDADGAEHAGWTSDTRDLILVHTGVARLYHVVLHEMGHALGGEHVDTDGALSGRPVRTNVIDAASRATVCERLACPLVAPAALPAR